MTPIQSVSAIVPWISALSWGLKTVAFWCSVRHHSTLKCTIGTSTNAMSAAIALRLPFATGSPRMRRRARDAAQRQVAEVEEEEDGGRDEARVPRPPDAPDRLAPQRAHGEREAGEE